jgi:hypothetical protein
MMCPGCDNPGCRAGGCQGSHGVDRPQTGGPVERLRAMLTEVRDRGLIYWEPNTSRGHESRAKMLADIDKVLEETAPRKVPEHKVTVQDALEFYGFEGY